MTNDPGNNIKADDKLILSFRFGIQSTPAIFLLASTATGRRHGDNVNEESLNDEEYILIKYKGPQQNTEIMYQFMLRQYYYYTQLTTRQAMDELQSNSKQKQQQQQQQQQQQNQAPAIVVKSNPRPFSSMVEIQMFLYHYRYAFFMPSTITSILPDQQALSLGMTVVERTYIQYLMGWEDKNMDENDTKGDYEVTLLVQQRCSGTSSSSIDRNDSGNSSDDYFSNAMFNTFNRLSRVLSDRRDVIFLALKTACASNEENGNVLVWKIPVTAANTTLSTMETSPDNWLFTLPGVRYAMFNPWEYYHYYNNQAGEGGKKNDNNDDNDETKSAAKTYVHSRLHEFVSKVTSPTLLWLDRETTAPIAFANGRTVHAVLFVDMHHSLLHELLSQEEKSEESYNDQDAKELIRTILRNDPITQDMRRAIQAFRNTCQRYAIQNFQSVMHRDMVCLVVPSTETRVLTALDIDFWSPLDAAASGEQETLPKIFPTVLITDQRSKATKRYYLDFTETDSKSNNAKDNAYDYIMERFVFDFWSDRLTPELKSDPRGVRVNKSGVRIITAESAPLELFDDNIGMHKLLLLVAPTCGHCKRISALWNQLGEFIQHVEWESMFALYRIDITSNDVEQALNLTVHWVPDVYYVEPNDGRRFIRYIHESSNADELMDGGDDGVGAIRGFMEIVEWLFVEILDAESRFGDDKSLRDLFANLEEKF